MLKPPVFQQVPETLSPDLNHQHFSAVVLNDNWAEQAKRPNTNIQPTFQQVLEMN
jgi:hypothetical protein